MESIPGHLLQHILQFIVSVELTTGIRNGYLTFQCFYLTLRHGCIGHDRSLRTAHLSVCDFCYTLVHPMYILSNRSQSRYFGGKEEEKLMLPHRAPGVYCYCYNEFTKMYVYKAKF